MVPEAAAAGLIRSMIIAIKAEEANYKFRSELLTYIEPSILF
jgi:hypothetical protein